MFLNGVLTLHYIILQYNPINKLCFKMVLDDVEQFLGYILCAMHDLLYINHFS